MGREGETAFLALGSVLVVCMLRSWCSVSPTDPISGVLLLHLPIPVGRRTCDQATLSQLHPWPYNNNSDGNWTNIKASAGAAPEAHSLSSQACDLAMRPAHMLSLKLLASSPKFGPEPYQGFLMSFYELR